MESFKEKKHGHEVIRGACWYPTAGLGAPSSPLPSSLLSLTNSICSQGRLCTGEVCVGLSWSRRWAGEIFALTPGLSGATVAKYMTLGY